MALFTYSARSLQINIQSLILPSLVKGHTVSGYAPDEFLNIETEDDDWVVEEGADGFVVRSAMPNKICTITLTLQQTSPTNKVLTALYNIGKGLDPVNGVGADIVTFDVKDPVTPFTKGQPPIFTTANAFVSKIAPVVRAKESGTRTWELKGVDGIFAQDIASAVLNATAQGVRSAQSFASNFSL